MSTVSEQTRKPNRLIDEGSPYLRQHAYNPVDWYAWGEEAFEKAKTENKPIFLSVGYSTCHWCHVMERESFEDEGIAELLNANFVPVKVDRERRPDVDETYMLATQLVTGHGGWPNSVFLTPDRKPFYAGTYFPIDAFRALLNQVTEYWATKTSALEEDAERLAATIESIMTRRLEAAEVTPEVLNKAAADLLRSFDAMHGGFGGAPKFPQESIVLFLLRLAEKDGHEEALKAVTFSLDSMLRGGIQDQAGGGFHRYAVDQRWLVPHFEKMLYNQALIVQALVRAYRLTGARRYAGAVRRALDYVLDDLTAPGGGFYSARDADSEGKEGAFYVWTSDQLSDALDTEEAAFAAKVFGVTAEGNFEDSTTVLHMPRSIAELAAELEMDEAALEARVDAIRVKLAEARAARPMPERDEKIIAAWNGMMIAAFAEAAAALGEKRYEAAALEAGAFLWEYMHGDDGLKRTFFEGQASLEGQQEDYAFAANGFIALHDLTRDTVWLERAETLIGRMVKDFRDPQAGDYYMSASSTTFGKAKARTDGGTPSGNSAALEAFARLSRRTRTPDHRDNGDALLAALSGLAASSPSACAYTLMAADLQQSGDAGARQFMAQGAVDAEAAFDAESGALTVRLRIAEGWHINADKPLEEAFVPTELTVEGAESASVNYPEAVRRTLGFHGKELELYEGDVTISAQLPDMQTDRLAVRLRLQACSDALCLEPETAELTVPLLRG